MANLEEDDDEFRGGPEFPHLIELMTALGFGVPHEKMRQSHNVTEAIFGTTDTSAQGETIPLGRVPPSHSLAVAAGINDIKNPFIFYRDPILMTKPREK